MQLDLLPFGEDALTHFLCLERPEGMERMDAAEFTPGAPPHRPVEPGPATGQVARADETGDQLGLLIEVAFSLMSGVPGCWPASR